MSRITSLALSLLFLSLVPASGRAQDVPPADPNTASSTDETVEGEPATEAPAETLRSPIPLGSVSAPLPPSP